VERLVECLGEGGEIRGVRRGRGGFVSNSEGDGATWVDSSGEADGEETVRVAKNAGGDLWKGSGDSRSVWVRGWGLTGSKDTWLGPGERRGPLFNWRGCHTRNLLSGRRLPTFVLALATRAAARGSLHEGGVDDVIRVEVAGGEGVEFVPPLLELAGFVGVGEQLGVLLGVTKTLARSLILESYWVFRVLSRGWGRGGRCSGPFLTVLRGRGAGGCRRWWGPVREGRRLGEDRDGGRHPL